MADGAHRWTLTFGAGRAELRGQVRLKEILADNPPWTELLSEQVLEQYLQLRHHRLQTAIAILGRDEVEQLLRIRLWQLWDRYDPTRGAPLYQWLVCNLDRYLCNIYTRHCKHMAVEVSLDAMRELSGRELSEA